MSQTPALPADLGFLRPHLEGDATIQALAAEVERLINEVFPRLTAGYHLNAPERAEAKLHREAARALLSRLGVK